jgi:hypothetical protein
MRCFARAIWQSSTPTMLLECPQSAFTLIASASAYIASKITRSASRKKSAKLSASWRSSSLCSESVV